MSGLTLKALHEALYNGGILNQSDDVDVVTHHYERYDLYWIEALGDCQSAPKYQFHKWRADKRQPLLDT
jgi:hypothetical protein